MEKQELKNETWFDKQAIRFEETRFASMTMMLLAQSCWGSIAAMYALKADNTFILIVCAAVTMASNAAFIAQVSAKMCLGIFYSSVLINLIILITALLL